jgi:hypothetical protein
MDNQVSDAETWKLGVIIKDDTNKEWKLVKVGSGETRSHKDAEKNFINLKFKTTSARTVIRTVVVFL